MRGDGPPNARILVVGEAWGATEEATGRPFMGASGEELSRMLHDAGIMRSECYVTNLVNARPAHNRIESWIPAKKKDVTSKHIPFRNRFVDPIIVKGYESLVSEIKLVRPNIIIAMGGSALWALTGHEGILRWRGSQLWTDEPNIPRTKLIPTIHPAAILREYSFRKAAVNDLKRVARERNNPGEYSNIPNWKFTTRPSFETAKGILEELLRWAEAVPMGVDGGDIGLLPEGLSRDVSGRPPTIPSEPLWIDFDFETRAGHIDCAGISWSRTDALCIPFIKRGSTQGYWSLEQEAELVWLLYRLLRHSNVWVRGQNLLYDAQYSYRHWCFVPNVKQDTMIAHHSVFSGLKKSLDYQASLYCDYYVQWKPDRTAWKEGG